MSRGGLPKRPQNASLTLVDACAYLHANNVVHRALKPSNVLLNARMEVKLAGFGLAAKFDTAGDLTHTLCGTAAYVAPEILARQDHGAAIDVWSVAPEMRLAC